MLSFFIWIEEHQNNVKPKLQILSRRKTNEITSDYRVDSIQIWYQCIKNKKIILCYSNAFLFAITIFFLYCILQFCIAVVKR